MDEHSILWAILVISKYFAESEYETFDRTSLYGAV